VAWGRGGGLGYLLFFLCFFHHHHDHQQWDHLS
jgi:hypothetical protein